MTRQVFAAFLLASLTSSSPEVRVDFRNKEFNEQLFRPEKASLSKYIVPEPEGLRINVQKGETGQPVGIVLQKRIGGDFDITVNYEFLKSSFAANWASSLQLYLSLDCPTVDGLIIARQKGGQSGEVCNFTHMVTTEARKRVAKESEEADVDPKKRVGRFRLVRTGANVAVDFAEGGNEQPLKHLATFVVGNEPIKLFRIGVNPIRSANEVDVRIFDVSIKAEDLQMSGVIDKEPDRAFGGGTALAIVIAILIVVAAGGTWFWQKRRRSKGTVQVGPRGAARPL